MDCFLGIFYDFLSISDFLQITLFPKVKEALFFFLGISKQSCIFFLCKGYVSKNKAAKKKLPKTKTEMAQPQQIFSIYFIWQISQLHSFIKDCAISISVQGNFCQQRSTYIQQGEKGSISWCEQEDNQSVSSSMVSKLLPPNSCLMLWLTKYTNRQWEKWKLECEVLDNFGDSVKWIPP